MSTGSGKPPSRKQKPTPDDPAQSARFVEAAKALEVDESGSSFKRAVKALLPAKRAKKPAS